MRLVERARAEGEVAGTAELVETGEVVPFRSADDLLALLLAPRGADHSATARATPSGSSEKAG